MIEGGSPASRPAPAPAANPSARVSRVFSLAHGQQNQTSLKKQPLADHCQEVAKQNKVSIDASTSGATKQITVVIGGREADVQTAKRALWARIAEKAVGSVNVPAECLRYIIGPGGKTLQTIHDACSGAVHVDIPARDAPYDGRVRIVGDIDAIEHAKRMIEDIVNERKAKAQGSVDVPLRLLPFLLLNYDNGPFHLSRGTLARRQIQLVLQRTGVCTLGAIRGACQCLLASWGGRGGDDWKLL